MDSFTKKELQSMIFGRTGIVVPNSFTKAVMIKMLEGLSPPKFNINAFQRRLSTQPNLSKSINMLGQLKSTYQSGQTNLTPENFIKIIRKTRIGNSTIANANVNSLFEIDTNKLKAIVGTMYTINPAAEISKNQLVKYLKAGPRTITRINGQNGNYINRSLVSTNKSVCKSGRMQIKGTCWFQSILNGWLLSYPARRLLIKGLETFKKSNNMKKWTKVDACPLNLSGAYFWSYIEYKLNEDYKDVNYYKNVMTGKQFSNRRLINNLQLAQNREGRGNDGAMPWDESIKFLNKVFPGQWGHRTFIKPIALAYFTDLKRIKSHPLYTRSHVIISVKNQDPVTGEKQGHAICGYRCSTGNLMVYDSNNLKSFKFDWLHDDPREYYRKTYKFENIYSVAYMVTYIKKTIDIPKLFGRK